MKILFILALIFAAPKIMAAESLDKKHSENRQPAAASGLDGDV